MYLKSALLALTYFVLTNAGADECSDFAVFSTYPPSSSYVTLSPKTLEIKGAGNLERFGVFAVNGFATGSTVKSGGFYTQRFYDYLNKKDEFGSPRFLTLDNLGSYYPATKTFGIEETLPGDELARYLILEGEDLQVVHFEEVLPDFKEKHVKVYDSNLGLASTWDVSEMRSLHMACSTSQGDIVVWSGAEQATLNKQGVNIKPIAGNGKSSGFYATKVSSGCHSISVSHQSPDSTTVDIRILDLEKNQIVSQFTGDRYATFTFINNGEQLLRQKGNVNKVPGTNGIRFEHAKTVKIYDVTTGKLSSSGEIPVMGEIVGNACASSGQDQDLLVKAKNKLYLIDSIDFSVIAEQHIPFSSYDILRGVSR